MGPAPHASRCGGRWLIVYVDIELAGITVAGRPGSAVYLRPWANVEAEHQRRTDAACKRAALSLAQMSHEIRTPLNAVLGHGAVADASGPSARQLTGSTASRRPRPTCWPSLTTSSTSPRWRPAVHGHPPGARFGGRQVDQALGDGADQAKVKSLALSSKIAETVPARAGGRRTAHRADPRQLPLTNAVSTRPRAPWRWACPASRPRASDWCCNFEVTDTGIGIDPTLLPSLLCPSTRWARALAALQRRGAGAISRQLARAMNGECGARSSPGHGSTFWCNVQVGLTDRDAHVPSGLETWTGPC